MEESNNYGHQHPLLLILNQGRLIHNQSGVTDCSRCGEKVSAPCFCCAEHCGFYLHKVCAEAPLELNHPFHHDHPLLLMQKPPYSDGKCICNFCDERCEKFIYDCSCCELDLHIKCALFTFNIAENNLKDLDHVALHEPLISTEIGDEELEDVSKCFGCWEPLAQYTHFSPDCGFNLHEKCAELPFKLNHVYHPKHPLVLQFDSQWRSCEICEVTRERGFVYGCSTCQFVVHVECASQSPLEVIESKNHEHPFTLLFRQGPFTCDACGIVGYNIAYTCGTCNIIIHKKCISLPRIIKSMWNDHRLLHMYFYHREDFRVLDCLICHDEVNTEHGSYYCSKCNVIFHVMCVTQRKKSYKRLKDEDEESPDESVVHIECASQSVPLQVIKSTNHEHPFTLFNRHQHPLLLMLNQEQLIDNQRSVTNCSRCGEKVSASCFCCVEHCGFYLHKVCAEAPLELNHPFHLKHPLLLMQNAPYSYGEYICDICNKFGDKYVYHCSCGLNLHIKCALFALNISENNLKELKHVALQDPLISTEDGDEKLKDVSKCFRCWNH